MTAYNSGTVPITIILSGGTSTHSYASGGVLDTPSEAYADGYAQGIAAVPPPDAVAPVITYVSPTPGAAPGAPGGFPADPASAKIEPIVILIGDVDPGVQYINVVVRYTDADGNSIEETVYRRDNFRGLYVVGSKAETVGADLRLTIKRNSANGWLDLITGSSRQFGFYVDVVDGAGNVSAEV